MSQRVSKFQTLPRKADRDGRTRVLSFERSKTLEKTKGGYVDVYEVRCGDEFFGFSYITSERYSIVWHTVDGFKFDLPYTLVEFLFSQKGPLRIKEFRPTFPFRKEKLEFSYQHATASMFLQGEETAREFDLLNQAELKKYRSEFLDQQPDSISRIAFARYDSEISIRTKLFKICFTAERLNQEANDDWEFVINLPRALVLNQFALRWVVENHEARATMEETTNFNASRDELSAILSR